MADGKSKGVFVVVQWGYEAHEAFVSATKWQSIIAGKAVRLTVRGNDGEGRSQWEYWNFSGGADGDLCVEYGSDGGVGWIGNLKGATIVDATEEDA